MEAWVCPQLEAWSRGVRIVGEIAKRHPWSYYSSLWMLLQLEWEYLQITFAGVGTLMGRIEQALRETFSPALFGGEEVGADFRKILGHSTKRGVLVIPDPGCQRSVHTTPPRQLVGNW